MISSSGTPPKLNRQSCELNEQGKALLQELLNKLYPKKRPFYSDIAFGAKVGRDWVSKFLQGKAQGCQAAKITAVFEYLEQEALEQSCELSVRFCEELHCQNHVFKQRSRQQVKQPSSRSEATESSSELKLVEALWSLNCDQQQYDFRTNWKRCDRAALVTLYSRGTLSQRWLVKRFARQVRGFGTAYNIPIQAGPFRPMVGNPQLLWYEIAKYLPEVEATKDAIIERLCQIAQTQSVVLAIYGLNSHTKRLQPLRQMVMEFWQELYEALHQQNFNQIRSQLVVFLIGDIDTANIVDTCRASPESVGEPLYSLRLPDLPIIESRDVDQWIGGPGDHVYKILCNFAKEVDINAILADELPKWSEAPDDVLRNLISLSGNMDLESHWELAG